MGADRRPQQHNQVALRVTQTLGLRETAADHLSEGSGTRSAELFLSKRHWKSYTPHLGWVRLYPGDLRKRACLVLGDSYGDNRGATCYVCV